VTVVPPLGGQSILIAPLCASMKRFAVDSSNPVPRAFVVKKGVKSFSRTAGEIPGPRIRDGYPASPVARRHRRLNLSSPVHRVHSIQEDVLHDELQLGASANTVTESPRTLLRPVAPRDPGGQDRRPSPAMTVDRSSRGEAVAVARTAADHCSNAIRKR
jgi:hypothetical protein